MGRPFSTQILCFGRVGLLLTSLNFFQCPVRPNLARQWDGAAAREIVFIGSWPAALAGRLPLRQRPGFARFHIILIGQVNEDGFYAHPVIELRNSDVLMN